MIQLLAALALIPAIQKTMLEAMAIFALPTVPLHAVLMRHSVPDKLIHSQDVQLLTVASQESTSELMEYLNALTTALLLALLGRCNVLEL